ncbi:Zn-dependent hydrolase, glyoxylase [Rhodovulum sulfidophilum]|uniref:Zn-dependent hydrolase, glyoxylase n=1 Tax=Rhodovulum sulfidophilum TaxID=35806 RepID=A0A0D6B4I7_RHOSU|nr:Zn-dependent hydrolase, glyoxylase [Rhodovulum sulfidophilum]
MGLDLAFLVEAMQPPDHIAAGIGAARILAEHLVAQILVPEGRELITNKFDIERNHSPTRMLPGRWNLSNRPGAARQRLEIRALRTRARKFRR